MKAFAVLWCFSLLWTLALGRTSKCVCGFGVYCLRFDGKPLDLECKTHQKECDKISHNFYKMSEHFDCNLVVDHCGGNPCARGACVSTFGGYFCDCPPGWYGQNCTIEDPDLDVEEVRTPVYNYYQVQTRDKGGKIKFHLIYDPGPQRGLMRMNETGVKVNISFSDGHHYYPTKVGQFKEMNILETCLRDVNSDPELFDIRVCDLLPEGMHWVFAFDSKIYFPYLLTENSDRLYHKKGYVGFVHNVTITIEFLKEGELVHTLYKSELPLFTYVSSQVPNTCAKFLLFDGCDLVKSAQPSHLRGQPVSINVFEWKSDCTGSKNIETKWSLQRGKGFEGVYDPVPVDVEFGGTNHIVFPARFFTDGEHMIEVRVAVKGNSPFYGGLDTYYLYGRCFLKIELGVMLVVPRGGNSIAASCFYNLEIELDSYNPGLPTSEMEFIISCTPTSPTPAVIDRECKERRTERPRIRKVKTPCGTVYTFNVTAKHFITKLITQELSVTVHFVNYQSRIAVECLFNCFPVDIVYNVVAVATTMPSYVPASFEWEISLHKSVLPRSDLELASQDFLPLTTTRIIRIQGFKLVHPFRSVLKLNLTANILGRPMLMASVVTQTNDLELEVGKFKLFRTDKRRNNVFRIGLVDATKVPNYAYPPVKYQIYQFNDWVRDAILTDTANNYKALEFESHFPLVLLCIVDSMNMKACSSMWSTPYRVKIVTDDDIMYQYEIGDTGDLLRHVVWFMTSQLVTFEPPDFPGLEFLTWQRIDLEKQRNPYLKMVLEQKNLRQGEIQTSIFICTMLFMSTDGNKHEKLYFPFLEYMEYTVLKKKYSLTTDANTYRPWLNTRTLAAQLLGKIIQWTLDYGRADKTGQLRLDEYTYGDILNGIIKCWNLAHLHVNVIDTIADILSLLPVNDPILDAQFQIMRRYNEKMSMESISLFVKAAYFYSKLFYGIRNIGYTHTRVWMTRTTYQGLIAAFNKSNTGDNECNFIFGPVNKRERWVDLAQIDLPPLNNVTDLTGRELGLVVVLVANRRQDESVTPTLIIYMTNSSNSYPRLPGSTEYSITLPILLGGIPANLSDKLQLTLSSLLRPSKYADRYKHFTVFKVVLPNDFEIWDLQIVMIERTPLKVKINLHQLPDYDDVANVTPSKPKYSRVLDYYVIAHVVKPEPPSLTIPRYFYVGLLLADSVPEEIKFTIGVRDTVNICWLQDIDMKSGEKTCKGKQLGLSLTVECVCDEFGIIIGRATPVRFATIMMNQINGTYDETITISQFSVPFILLAICVGLILVMIYADMQRQKKDILVRMQDTHIWDTYPIVIGVYTKSNFLSGTISSVAIKIEGRNSSSRVHLLKHKSRKLLNRGNDDWFLFTTNQPLGRIQHVYLWHNYHCLSNWYCDYILIYDIYQGNWYMAEVNRWFRLHPNMDDSRFAQIRTVKFNNVETGLKAMPGKIKCHILNELRNSHYVHSLRKLHLRSLYTFENRILAFQTKLIGIIFGSFFVQALQLFNVGDYYGTVVPSSEDIHFTRDTVWIIIIVDVISYAFAFPYILIIRSRFMSGFIQKKTTNPINVEVIRKEKKDAFAPYKKVKKLKAEQPKEKETKMESKGRYVLFAEGSTLMQESEKERERNWEEYQAQKQPTTLWLATLLRQSWAKKALILVFGPTQFRCINAPGQIFDLKNKRRIVYARLYAGFVLLVGFSAIFFILEFTNFGAKYNVTIFYLILVLVYDTFLLNPIIIILHAFVIFMVLQTSSREYHFWSASNELELPKPLDFVDYFYTAIKPAYKPLPSSEIEKIKKVSRMSNRMKMFFLYLYTMLCIVFLVRILNTRYDVGYYFSVRAIRAITEDRKLSVGITGKGKVQTSIRQVLEPESAQDFITSVFGELKYEWPNNKRMDFTSRQDRWFLDRESKIIGPASVLITRTPTKNQLKMPKYFTDIFSDAFGFISESGVEEMPVTLSGIHMNHTSLHPSVTVQGKSGTNYYLVGNQAIIPTIEWKAYYYNLATLFEDLSTRKDVVPRLIVISYKILTANTFRLTLIDLIVEYMPSGECSAVLNIASIKVTSDDVTTSVISRSLLLVLVTVHVIIAVAGVSTMGFIEYSTHSYGMVKVILSASGILMVFTTFVCYFPQHVVLDKLFKLPADVFLDLHDIDAKFALDSTALSLFLFVMCLDLAVAVKDALSLKIITAVFAKGFRTILAIMLILIIYTKAASLSANMNYSFLIPVFFKVLLPLDPGITEERFFITIAIISVCLCSKFCLAVFVYHFEIYNKDYVSQYHPEKLRSTSAVKTRYLKKHSVRSHMLMMERKKKPSDVNDYLQNYLPRKSTASTRETTATATKNDEFPPEPSAETDGKQKLEARTEQLDQKRFDWRW